MNDKPYFKSLDSIRFIAASMVLLSHTSLNTIPGLSEIPGFFGRLGVLLFFVLSGFLITYMLLAEEEATGRISLKKFYMRRALRIWPLYFVAVTASIIYYSYSSAEPFYHHLAYYFTFLSNVDFLEFLKHGNSDVIPLSLKVTWSVSVEEQFYLFWPLLFVLMPRKYWSIPIATVMIFSILFRYYNRSDENVLSVHTFAVLIALAIGGLYAYMVKQSIAIRRLFESANTLILLLPMIAVVLFYKFYGIGGWIQDIVFEVLFGFIITCQAISHQKYFLNVSNIRFAANWGKYTYAIYLLHPIGLSIANYVLMKMHLTDSSYFYSIIMVQVIITFCATLFISMLSYRFLESPFLKMKEKLSFGGKEGLLLP